MNVWIALSTLLFGRNRKGSKSKINRSQSQSTMLTIFLPIAEGDVSAATRANYQTAVRSFLIFHGKSDIALSGITAERIHLYERWLRERGVCRNTASCYLRSLRAIYNKGVAHRKVRDAHPFEKVFTGSEPTIKRSLKASELHQLQGLELSQGSFLAFSRDLFLFSFRAMGMPPVDFVHLRRMQLCGDTLTYHRHKTGRLVTVRIDKTMRTIIQRYHVPNSDYLFPILERYTYRSFLSSYNRALKTLGKLARISTPLSSYLARHSWASLANERNIALPVIAAALGHSNTRTTLFYISEIDNQVVARENKKLLDGLFRVALRKKCTMSANRRQK